MRNHKRFGELVTESVKREMDDNEKKQWRFAKLFMRITRKGSIRKRER
jgi:hypothetical protein